MNWLTGWPSRKPTTVGIPWTPNWPAKSLVAVDVHFGELEPAIEFAGQLLQQGAEYFARTAPCCPEVDHDRNILASLDYLSLERGGIDIFHISRGHDVSGLLAGRGYSRRTVAERMFSAVIALGFALKTHTGGRRHGAVRTPTHGDDHPFTS